jgi:lactate permease
MQTPPVTLINWLLALSPIAIVLVLMVGFRWGGNRAGPVGWVVGLAVAWLFFGAGPDVLFYSQVQALLLSLFVLYIIWMALVFYRVVDEAGAIAVTGQGIARLTGDRVMQLLLLAWAFSSFLQGVAAFGVPIAVVAPLLIGLGFPPLVAVASVAIGHSWSVTFGSMSSSFQALMAATGLSGQELAPWSAAFLGVACLGCGIGAVWAYQGWRSVRRGALALLLMSGVMVAVQTALAVSGLWTLAGFVAGLAGLAVGAIVARLPTYQQRDRNPEHAAPVDPSQPPGAPGMSLKLALIPYLILFVVVATAELWPRLHDVLNQVQIRVPLPEVSTSYGWTMPAGVGRTISVLGHAGALLAYVSVISYALYRLTGHYAPGVVRRIVRQTVRSAMPASIGIASMVGFAVAMDYSGMTYVLAEGLARAAGPAYPVVAPFIGLLGAFMTGSNTNSNVVFAPLQQQAAAVLGINALIILGAQTTGGALGSMIAPAKVILGCSTAGLPGQEGRVLIKTLPPALIISGLVGVLALILILAQVV